MDLPYYHGQLTKRECEALLLKGGVDGNFLIRDSESVPGALCLCVSKFLKCGGGRERERKREREKQEHKDVQITRFKRFVYTYRIFREKYGYYNIQTKEGSPKQIFPNLEELVSKYEKPGQGLVVHLSNPIMRKSFCPRETSKLELNVYENSDEDYVDVLP
ncbi:SH2 domain-containing protein 1B isoform X1 [Meriones unguiculatus]|uniref:SH2 domain-containing protein 1B isoform X1 n=1 Tax=Meriones unguiculatus TaxID=10047 RepID=UPI00293E6C2E|nr:SH2 domain-containing protein 1B isoform X1 [Meriones unguiculatus]